MARALLFPLTMLLLIATAVALLASAMILPMSGVPALSEPVRTDVVERFYAAANEAIATGNPAALRRVVPPSFADETPLPGVSPDRDGLEAYLATLHDTDPGLRLEPRVIVAGSQQVMAEVAVARASTAATQPATLGAQQAVWSPVEVLRVADGVVVGRWGHTDGLAFTRPLAAHTLDLSTKTRQVISLKRVTQAPGTRWDAAHVTGPRLLVVQQGDVDVLAVPSRTVAVPNGQMTNLVAWDDGRVHPPINSTLGAGQSWQTPAGAVTSVINAGRSESQVLVVSFTWPQIPDDEHPRGSTPPAPPLSSGVTVQVLAGDPATDIASGPVSVTLERITLMSQASLTRSSADGPIMVAVEMGQTEAATWGTAWERRTRDGMRRTTRAATLSPDNGLLLQQHGVVTLRNVEPAPAQALVLTVRGLSEG